MPQFPQLCNGDKCIRFYPYDNSNASEDLYSNHHPEERLVQYHDP